MEAAARLVRVDSPAVVFEDGLGQRLRNLSDTAGGEVLALRTVFAAVPSFEFALRERVGRLASFRHTYYARVRGVERGTGMDQALRVVSDAGPGIRMSELLAGAHARRVPIDINAALCLVRQLVPAVAMLHESARDVAHGAIAPERLLVTPQARLVIVEHMLGAALEQLRYSRERYWAELRVPLPAGPNGVRFDHRSDVLQIGVVALSLILGRPLRTEEFPGRIGDVVASTWAVSPRGGFEPLPPGLRGWLARALQIDPHRSFQSAGEARAELDALLGDSELVASPASLEAFLARYEASDPPAIPVASFVHPAPVEVAEETKVPSTVNSPAPLAMVVSPHHAVAPHTFTKDISTELLSLAAPLTTPSERESATSPSHETFDVETDPHSELAGEFFEEPSPSWWRNWRVMGAAAVVLAVVVAGGARVAFRPAVAPIARPASGTLEIASNPAGVEAFIDGTLRGTTPMVIALDPGAHSIELRGVGQPRTIPITIASGMKVSQYVELSGAAPGVDLAPVAVRSPEPVRPAAPVVEVLPTRAAAARTGGVSFTSPVGLQVFEGGARIGDGRERLELTAGRHELELVNAELGVRIAVGVDVTSGRTSTLTPQLPSGNLSINAVPWAEVWVDGEKVGETPMGNLQVPVGSHDVLLRHPELGERHQAVVVTTKPARLSVDLRAK
jgi:hypothetical protein